MDIERWGPWGRNSIWKFYWDFLFSLFKYWTKIMHEARTTTVIFKSILKNWTNFGIEKIWKISIVFVHIDVYFSYSMHVICTMFLAYLTSGFSFLLWRIWGCRLSWWIVLNYCMFTKRLFYFKSHYFWKFRRPYCNVIFRYV